MSSCSPGRAMPTTSAPDSPRLLAPYWYTPAFLKSPAFT